MYCICGSQTATMQGRRSRLPALAAPSLQFGGARPQIARGGTNLPCQGFREEAVLNFTCQSDKRACLSPPSKEISPPPSLPLNSQQFHSLTPQQPTTQLLFQNGRFLPARSRCRPHWWPWMLQLLVSFFFLALLSRAVRSCFWHAASTMKSFLPWH